MSLDLISVSLTLALVSLALAVFGVALANSLSQFDDGLMHISGSLLALSALWATGSIGSSMETASGRSLGFSLPLVFLLLSCWSSALGTLRANGRRASPFRFSLLFAVASLFALASALSDREAFRLSARLLSLALSGALLWFSAYSVISESMWRHRLSGSLFSALEFLGGSLLLLMAARGGSFLSFSAAQTLLLGSLWIASKLCFFLMLASKARATLDERALRDPLTALLSRRAFQDAAIRSMSQCSRDGVACSLLMIDLDHFKRINDTHGHLAGDQALIQASRSVESSLRSSDLCGRFGGEELICFLPGADPDQAREVAERALSALRAHPLAFEGSSIALSASIGISSRSASSNASLQDLIARADAALYEAKRLGRDQARFGASLS